MLGKIITKFVLFLLKKNKISLEERHLLINGILDKLGALPLRDIIVFSDDGSLLVNGKVLSYDERVLLRESARGCINSRALGLVRDQVLYKSFIFGINASINLEQLYFAKAAVWWGIEEDKFLKALADLVD